MSDEIGHRRILAGGQMSRRDEEWPDFGRSAWAGRLWQTIAFHWQIALFTVTGIVLSVTLYECTGYANVTYYATTIRLHYKGDPVTLRVVSSCGWYYTYIGFQKHLTYDLEPNVYGMRLADGNAIAVHPPDLCIGGKDVVNKPNFPAVMFSEDKGDIDFMLAYVQPEAYERANSPLKLVDYSYGWVDAAEWRQWRSNAPANVLSPDPFAGTIKATKTLKLSGQPVPEAISDPPEYMDMACFGVWEVPIPADKQAEVDAAWPPDRPRFWWPSDFEHGFSRFYRSVEKSFEAAQEKRETAATAPVYPADFSGRIGLHESGQPYVLPLFWTITIADDMRGLAYCYRQGPNYRPRPVSSVVPDDLAHRLVINGTRGLGSLSIASIYVLESDKFFLKGLVYSPISHKGGL
jgi:hypothetical protein